uniref:HAT C-terminal dimerisation domain-containing protein n=1 Tax=Solanum lycopersicum TaxID=4081 RepID=A0A3Q7GY04_SOLLC
MDNIEKPNDFNILTWWKASSNRYPTISKNGKECSFYSRVYCASESTFSTGDRILDSYRNSLSQKTVDILIFTQQWIRSPSKEWKVQNYLEEVQKIEEVEKGYWVIEQLSRGVSLRIFFYLDVFLTCGHQHTLDGIRGKHQTAINNFSDSLVSPSSLLKAKTFAFHKDTITWKHKETKCTSPISDELLPIMPGNRIGLEQNKGHCMEGSKPRLALHISGACGNSFLACLKELQIRFNTTYDIPFQPLALSLTNQDIQMTTSEGSENEAPLCVWRAYMLKLQTAELTETAEIDGHKLRWAQTTRRLKLVIRNETPLQHFIMKTKSLLQVILRDINLAALEVSPHLQYPLIIELQVTIVEIISSLKLKAFSISPTLQNPSIKLLYVTTSGLRFLSNMASNKVCALSMLPHLQYPLISVILLPARYRLYSTQQAMHYN